MRIKTENSGVPQADVYQVHASTHWFSFLQDYDSIRKLAPERLEDPQTLQALKEKFAVQIDSIGMTEL